MADLEDKKVLIIPLIGFFTFWFANVIAGIIVVALGLYNPFANPLSPLFDNQVAGPYPLNIWEFLFLVVVLQIPVYVTFAVFLIKLFRKK
ncbi:MAG: hypothetical protein ACXQS8_02935 [Candidatus Helarchaeales archaeon]